MKWYFVDVRNLGKNKRILAIEELFARRGICEEYNGTKNGAEQ